MSGEAAVEERSGFDASNQLQVSATIAALTLALAELGVQRGPMIGDFRALTLTLLFAGLLALFGSMYAMAQLWEDAGMTLRDLLLWEIGRPSGDNTYARSSLVCIAWGLGILALVYLILIAGNAL